MKHGLHYREMSRFQLGLRQAPWTADEVANLDTLEEEVLADG
jgi:hypothetical protein